MQRVPRVHAIRRDESAVSPVIATILMVAITVVLAAVLYVMVSGFLPPIGGNKPLVAFDTTVTPSSGNATLEIASASEPPRSPSNYRVNLEVGAVAGGAVAMPTTTGAFVLVDVGGTTYQVQWTDIGGGGTVNAGDRFLVAGNGIPLPSTTSFTLFLIWSDGSVIAQRAWTTP